MDQHVNLAPRLGQAFAVREFGDLGIPTQLARRAELDRPFHGVRSSGLDLDATSDLARAFAAVVLPGQAFSHSTALALHRVPLPSSHGDRLHLSVEFPRTPPRGAGIHGHALRRHLIQDVAGLPVAPPATAWCQAAALLSKDDLVAIGDRLVTGERVTGGRAPALTSIEELASELALHAGSPGSARASWALTRIRRGVDSIMETRLRLTLVRAGLPEPEVDAEVITAGRAFHVDLAYPELRIAIEYEGDQHRTDQLRFRRDITRREALEATGWRVIRVTVDDLRDPRALASRIRAVIALRRAESRAK